MTILSDKDMRELYNNYKQKVLESEGVLSAEEEKEICGILDEAEQSINKLEWLKLKFGQIIDYNDGKKQGASLEVINKYYREDGDYLKTVDALYADNLKKRDYMFGYPANMESYSYISDYLRYLEGKMYLMNNCGDPYQRGNYGMDSKQVEQQIISMFAENLGMNGGKYWGYITSGGTESNFWAIREGFNRFPKGKLYFSEDTHYSVEKFVSNNTWNKVYPYRKIASNPDGTINVAELISAIESDNKSGQADGAILILTWGTTAKGAIDPVREICDALHAKGLKFYCHLDAALYGGIPSTQKGAPVLDKGLKVDSVSISLHKFVGISRVNGILISLDRDRRKIIDYIGQEDSTVLGSRDFLPFSTLQRVKEMLYRKTDGYYGENLRYFEGLLKDKDIYFEHYTDTGNIYVIKKPSDEVCKKYQLATFIDADGVAKAHVIIFPFHKKGVIDELVGDLTSDYGHKKDTK